MKRFVFALLVGCAYPDYVFAQRAVEVGIVETIDVASVVRGGARDPAYVLDKLNLTADADLGALVGWRGGTAHLHGMSTIGGRPNDAAGTLQGINNIEVASHHVRLFEAWVEQRLGERTTVRTGVYDLNSEFYVNGAAGLLIGPAFGVGSELAATGPNGPSIFPSTALAVRVEHRFGHGAYGRIAVLNGSAGALGDPGGVDFSFRTGVLAIAEAGLERPGLKVAAGYWRYSQRQDDYVAVDAAGAPVRRRAYGGYVLGEVQLIGGEDVRTWTAFARLGVSDGTTTPFRGGWQAGFLIERVFVGRPDSAFSLGANQGVTTRGYRALLGEQALRAADAETAFEITYSDRVAKWLTLQPDLQWVLDRGGEAGARGVAVATLRMTLEF